MSAPKLEVRHLRLMRALAEEGGPTRAAARLHLTQSAVSHQLAELEDRLGVALFARVRRRLELTPAGARLVAASRELLAELVRVEHELHHAGTRKRTSLRLAVECFTTYHWLPPIAAALAVEHPHVDVRIVAEATRDPIAALVRGAIDLALVSSPVGDRALDVVPAFRDEWVVVLSPSHRLAKRRYVGVRDLAGERLFTHDASRSDVERLRELAANERATLPRPVLVPFTDALVEMVRSGVGAALASRWAVAPWVARGEIVALRFTERGLAERWSVAYRRDAVDRLPIARFIELGWKKKRR